jgi:hypothetical protein
VWSKNLDIGGTECHFKIIKAAKSGQHAKLAPEKCKKNDLIYEAEMQQRSQHKAKQLLTAGKL